MYLHPLFLKGVTMNIILYDNKNPKNKIGKTLVNSNSITGTLRGETSTSNIQMLLNIVDLNPFKQKIVNVLAYTNFKGGNNKYYFIQ